MDYMPWCPKCKAEYREGFNLCANCNIELVNELEPELDEDANVVYDKEAFLTTVANASEALVIEALLQSYGISVLRKYKGAGDYLQISMGATVFGIDLYVSSQSLETAKEVLDTMDKSGVEIEKGDLENEEEGYYPSDLTKKRSRRILIIALIFIPGFLLIAISVIWELSKLNIFK